jgi:heme/copper-type cytochrome/quinol oxidase subunit 4
LTNIENLKNDCVDNAELLIVLDDIEKTIINRKNVFESFFDLFKSDKIDLKQPEIVVRVDTVYIEIKDTIVIGDTIEIIPTITEKQNEIRENIATDKKSRSQLWHTISSSFLFIIVLLILPFIPFTQKKIDWNLILGVIILMIPIAGLIWLYQFLLGLIPVILDKPWINYILNFVIHIFSLLLIIGFFVSISQKKDNKK